MNLQENKNVIIKLAALVHKKKEWISLEFPINYTINNKLKTIATKFIGKGF